MKVLIRKVKTVQNIVLILSDFVLFCFRTSQKRQREEKLSKLFRKNIFCQNMLKKDYQKHLK